MSETTDLDVAELDPATLRVALRGRLDAASADRMELRLTAAVAGTEHNVVLDFAGVEFMGSLGIRMLVSVARVLERRGRRIAICAPQAPVLEVMEVVALDQLIPIFPTEAEARFHLAG